MVDALAMGCLLGAQVAVAADPVLFSGENENVALGRVVVATGLAPSAIEPLPLAKAVEGIAPSLAGVGRVASCGRAATSLADVRGALDRARQALDYAEMPRAAAALDDTEAALACLSEPVDPTLAAGARYLRGVAAISVSDKAAAWEAFRGAHVVHPGMQWDPDYPPDGRPVFDAAGAEVRATPATSLAVVPPPRPGEMWVDGRAVDGSAGPVAVLPGDHIVQLGRSALTTLVVHMEPEAPARLVVPSALPDDAAWWAADPHRRSSLGIALGATPLAGRIVYVTAAGGVWRTTAGSDAWEELAAPVAAEVDAARDAEARAAPPSSPPPAPAVAKATAPVGAQSGGSGGRTLLWAGTGVAFAGGAVVGVSYLQGLRASDDMGSAPDGVTWDEANSRYESAGSRYTVGWIAAGSGAALAVTGLLLDDTVHLVPGPGLALTVEGGWR